MSGWFTGGWFQKKSVVLGTGFTAGPKQETKPLSKLAEFTILHEKKLEEKVVGVNSIARVFICVAHPKEDVKAWPKPAAQSPKERSLRMK